MEVYRRTIYGATLQAAQFFGIPALIQNFSTLNEKLSIQSSATLGANEMPTVGYLVIGNGGHMSVPGQDDIPLISNKIHKADDASPFKLFPFVLRPVTTTSAPHNVSVLLYVKSLTSEAMTMLLTMVDVSTNKC